MGVRFTSVGDTEANAIRRLVGEVSLALSL
jgi:hypothetical protein